MLKKIIFRMFIAVMFAIPFGLVAVAGVQANVISQDEPTDPDCRDCHPSVYAVWETSHHGQAMSDSTFMYSWEEQGKSQECLSCHTTGYDANTGTFDAAGVTCEACHSPLTSNHPEQPMPTDRSVNLCGTCHQETVFEWQVSHHRSADLSCIDCHGQHSTTLKGDDAQALCASCHRDRASGFAHSAHSIQGLMCADCHLSPTDEDLGEGHAALDHSFHVRLSTCNACHEYDMHDPVEVHAESQEPVTDLDAMASATNMGVNVDPDPISPIYYALLSALVGMAFGLLVAPWIERWYHRLDRNTRIDE
jgi:predicted CXXCH cytochrome family protein